MALRLITPPSAPPVTLAEAKAHVREDGDGEDALIAGYIAAAADHVQTTYGRALMPATWEYSPSCGFPQAGRPLRLPLPPLIELVSVEYRDADGSAASIDLADIRVIQGGDWPSSLVLDDGSDWPATDGSDDAVTVTFRAGYESAVESPPLAANSAIPASIHTALLLIIGHFYAQRENSDGQGKASPIPMGAEAMLTSYRVWGLP